MIYFTSDPHFGHRNIIRYCNRPFANVNAMDAAMIARWNETVTGDDTVYVIGDFSCFTRKPWTFYVERLNGVNIIIIPGSHDEFWRDGTLWDTATDGVAYVETSLLTIDVAMPNTKKQWITLCHYPLHSWPKSHFNSWHLHGHHHVPLQGRVGKTMNVCADLWDFTPVSLDRVKEYMNEQGDNWDYIKGD